MGTTGLIFAAIAIAWLAYLVPHFVRRRDDESVPDVDPADRFADSMLAYQGFGSGRDLDELRTLTRIATGGLKPDMTFFLDLPAQQGLDRKRKAALRPNSASPLSPKPPAAEPPEWNRLDARDLAYHERVRDGFLQLVQLEPERWHVLDANLAVDDLGDRIWQMVQPRLRVIRRLEDHSS